MRNDGTWTCSGNTFFWSVNGISGSGTLSLDGRTITGAGAISRRSGPRNEVRSPAAPSEPGMDKGPTSGRLSVRS